MTPQEIRDAISQYGSRNRAADQLGVPRSTFKEQAKRAFEVLDQADEEFSVEQLPDEEFDIETIRERRRQEFYQKQQYKDATKLVDININVDGVFGIAHMGDPHLDDNGTNFPLLEKHVQTIHDTPKLFGANVGDYTNAWVGRLAGLYAKQNTTEQEAWKLTEWFINAVPWLYLIEGNHDHFAQNVHVIRAVLQQNVAMFPHGVRMKLKLPSKRKLTINARHDFKGHSMWNPAHGPARAAQMGFRDDILTCGHKHVSGYNMVKDPASGKISHAIRVGAYKEYDEYAEANGFVDHNFSPCATTIINPYAKSEVDFITTIWDMDTAADFLNFLRRKHD